METTGDSCHEQQQGGAQASTCPPWLQSAIADIEQRVQSLSLHHPEKYNNSDSFAERAENYYHKRPQLLSLLHDLHKSYLYLAERYSLSILPKHHPIPSSSDAESVSSDADSSLSFQPPPSDDTVNTDDTLTALTLAFVDRDVLAECISEWDRSQRESSRKVELQRSLLDLLESERMVLIAENSQLAFRAVMAEEEARAMAAEAGYVRKKAGELARCVVRMREEGGGRCALWRTIEALQKQVYALQKRNGELYEVMVKREREEEVRMEAERLREENARLRVRVMDATEKGRWWKRVDWGLFGHCGSIGDCGGGGKGEKSLFFGDHFQCL